MSRKERKIRQYSKEDLQQALDAIDKNNLSIYRAARQFKVPRSTLSAYKDNRNRTGRMGPSLTFTTAEEDLMVSWILDMYRKGLIIRRPDLIEAAQWILETHPRNRNCTRAPRDSWCRGFEKRHPQISLHLQTEAEKSPQLSSSQCYEHIFQHLDNLDVFDEPRRIFKYNEIKFGLGTQLLKLFAGNANEEFRPDLITTGLITSAGGQISFPMIVYPYKEAVPPDVASSIPLFYGCGNNPTGMMSKQTFFYFVTRIFYKFLVLQKVCFPVMLFIDGTNPNVSLELWEACQKLEICLVAYNPYDSLNNKKHTPVITSLTRHVQSKLSDGLCRWKEIYPDCVIKEENYTELLQPVMQLGINKELIVQDWTECPFYQWILQHRNQIEEIEFVSADREESTD
ncbi:uncharacterized protein LOC128740297 [Sabethes cyaneus]|uniref:uncharacterized protein LOC128740297 n=1 Tax=Sabethes cyaneus TaxID=53552 RepID=UPI00237D6BF8|nr:uncharacterized protein LOC128740297 [Sabethes cyaneus]